MKIENQEDLFSGSNIRRICDWKTPGDDGLTLAERFERFHHANPEIADKLIDMGLWLKKRGFKKGSAKMIVERLRWEVYFQTKGAEEYKLSNSYTSFYARLVVMAEPELADFFTFTKQKDAWGPSAALVDGVKERRRGS